MSKHLDRTRYSKHKHWWIPSRLYDDVPAHVKRAQEKAVEMRVSGDSSPVSAYRLAFHYHSHRSIYWKHPENLPTAQVKQSNDMMQFAMPQNVDCEALFYYHDNNIVSVLRDKRDSPSPRLRFSLCGYNTKSTRDRLNRYAVDLGVKFYCWRWKNSAWCIWVHDGTVFWGPISNDDSLIATNE